MAYVEFLNLEDAVHFMESNQVAHPHTSTSAVHKQEDAGVGGVGGGVVGRYKKSGRVCGWIAMWVEIRMGGGYLREKYSKYAQASLR